MFAEMTSTIPDNLRHVCVIDKSCPKPLIAVVRENGIAVGAVFFSPANDGEVLGMGVLPSHRRRGIARTLWRFVAAQAGVSPNEVVAEPVTAEGRALCASMWRE
jgi:ribosomal protein S18 acetylase RimI-like enzyme